MAVPLKPGDQTGKAAIYKSIKSYDAGTRTPFEWRPIAATSAASAATAATANAAAAHLSHCHLTVRKFQRRQLTQCQKNVSTFGSGRFRSLRQLTEGKSQKFSDSPIIH